MSYLDDPNDDVLPSKTVGFLRLFLWLLFPFAAIWAFMVAAGSLIFGTRLFLLTDPGPTVLALAIIALPMVILHTVRHHRNDRNRLALTAFGIIVFVCGYVASIAL